MIFNHVVVPAAIVIAISASGCTLSPSESDRTSGVRVAAAADLKFAFDDVLDDFARQYPDIPVDVTYGSSGNFYAQLTNRAPFDIYFSADMAYPRRLVEQGLADKDSEFLYAVGQIVVWVPERSPIDVETLGIGAVVDPSVRKIAIANPKHAPYGVAAREALEHFGLWGRVEPKLVLGENIAQTAQFVESGAADIGIIALSLATAPALRDKGKHWQVPLNAYPTMEQGSVILNWARNREATDHLRSFVSGPRGRDVLKRYGFSLPEE